MVQTGELSLQVCNGVSSPPPAAAGPRESPDTGTAEAGYPRGISLTREAKDSDPEGSWCECQLGRGTAGGSAKAGRCRSSRGSWWAHGTITSGFHTWGAHPPILQTSSKARP